jgi:farnesyl-diphosphate farnesyltransferase
LTHDEDEDQSETLGAMTGGGHAANSGRTADAFGRAILPSVSRTFALSIRFLPGELGAAVRCAYLICRIADTIEDAPSIGAARKAELLDELAALFDDPSVALRLSSSAGDLGGDRAHVELVRNADLVFAAYRDLPPATRQHVSRWVREMIRGMRKFVLAYPQGIRIQTVDEYKEYCYYVAGTVGYLVTDLWREHSSSISARRYEALRARCAAFAEALQTINVLRDVARDARQENSIYVPDELLRAHGSTHATILDPAHGANNRAALSPLVQLAWRDLDEARTYLLTIPRRAVAIRFSCVLPLVFAYATLRDLTRVPGAFLRHDAVKISRGEVKSLLIVSAMAVLSNRALSWLVERARTRPLILVP